MADNYGQWFITKMFTDAEAAAVTSGKQITFKKMIASQDIFTQDDLATLTNSVLGTIDIKQQVNISTVLPSTGSYKVQGVFSNSTITADYLMNTILLVGSYNGAEFLAAAQVANNAFKMPAASTGEQTIYTIAAQISVSNTATVSLTVDPDSIVTNAGLKVVTDAQAVKDSAQNAEISDLEAKDSQNVKVTENQTIDGAKTFTQQITGSISGNAGSANKFTTPRKIDGVEFDGTQDIVLDVVHNYGDENITGVKTFTDPLIANYPIKGNTQRYYIEDGYDLNGYTDVGDFILNGANNLVNYPNAASTYASLHVEKLSDNTSIQTLTDSNHRIFTRIYGGNPASFGEWRMIDSPYRLVPVPSYIGSFYSLLDFQKKEYGLGTTVIYSSVNISYNDGPHTVSNTFKVTVDLFNWKNGNLSNYAFIKVEEPNSIYRGYYDYKGFSGWSKQTYG